MHQRRLWRWLLLAALALLAPAWGTQASVGVETSGSVDAVAALSLPQVVIPPGVEVVLDLKLTNNPGDVRGVDLTLVFTPTVVELRSIAKGSLAADWLLVSHSYPSGRIEIALAGVTPPTGDVVLARLTFRGIGQKGQASAVAFQSAALNETDALASALAGQIALDTPPVTDLRAGRTSGVSGSVTLTWSHVGSDAHHYEVWRATNLPYFTPPQGDPIAPNVAPSTGPSYTDGNSGLGTPGANSFYLVRSVDAAGRPAPTYNRVGAFNFALTPGGQ